MLSVRGLTVEIGGTLLVEGAGFSVRAGDRVGLVGRNGAGKTSLLRVLGGMAPPKSGVIQRPTAFGYLPQDPRLDQISLDVTAVSHVLGGRGLDELANRLEELHQEMERRWPQANGTATGRFGDDDVGGADSAWGGGGVVGRGVGPEMEANPGDEQLVSRWSRTHDRFEHAGGYAAEAEAKSLLAGLGLRQDRTELPIAVLSGGERRRVELARILFAGSEALLLDEPTNHLDNDARDWLFGFLRSYRGALVVVSHDLELLDDSITRVLHLDRPGESDVGELTEYKGTYSQYRVARARDEERRAKVAAQQQAEIARLQTLVDRFGAGTKAAFANAMETRIGRIRNQAVDAPSARRGLRLKVPDPTPSGRTSLTVTGLTKSYGTQSPPVFEEVGFDIGRGERLLVLGLNGAGKTSLLRILAGESTADAGTVSLGYQVSVGYYAQEHEGIQAGRSVLDHMTVVAPTLAGQVRRRLLGTFGLSGDKVDQDAATLSGGEKTKLALALLVAGRHNLLLLDEPTNNLDPPSREAVAAALASWAGTMVIVSHDVGFVRDLAPDRALLMPEGDVDHWSDDLLDLVDLA